MFVIGLGNRVKLCNLKCLHLSSPCLHPSPLFLTLPLLAPSRPFSFCSPAHPARLHPGHFFVSSHSPCSLLLSPSSPVLHGFPDCRLCRGPPGANIATRQTRQVRIEDLHHFIQVVSPPLQASGHVRVPLPTRPPTRPPTPRPPPTRTPWAPTGRRTPGHTVPDTQSRTLILLSNSPPLRGLGLRGGCPHRGRRGGCTEMGRRQGKHLSPSPLVHPPRRPY